MGIIYKITCLANDKVYIGQTTKALEQRWVQHLSDAKRNTCACVIHRAMRKHGPENFTISEIERCDNSLLNEREKFWISELHSYEVPIGYNRTLGGNEPLAPDVLKRLSEMKLGDKNPMFGKHHTPETRARMSATRKGRPAHNKGKYYRQKGNRMVTAFGLTLTVSEWGRKTGIKMATIHRRLSVGWSAERAVSAPVVKY